MAVALFIPSFSTTPAGQLHCQAVIELSFSAPAQEDSSSDEFVTFTTKEAKTGIFTHRWGYGYFPRAHRLSLLTKRVSLFAAWQLNCRAVRRPLTWWRIKVEIAEGKPAAEMLGWFWTFFLLRCMSKWHVNPYIDITLRRVSVDKQGDRTPRRSVEWSKRKWRKLHLPV